MSAARIADLERDLAAALSALAELTRRVDVLEAEHASQWWCEYREITDVVAVASLGCETLKAAIEFAGEVAPKCAVVWRVLNADEFFALVPLQWVDVGAPKAAVEADRALRSLGVRVERVEAQRVVLAVEACR